EQDGAIRVTGCVPCLAQFQAALPLQHFDILVRNRLEIDIERSARVQPEALQVDGDKMPLLATGSRREVRGNHPLPRTRRGDPYGDEVNITALAMVPDVVQHR